MHKIVIDLKKQLTKTTHTFISPDKDNLYLLGFLLTYLVAWTLLAGEWSLFTYVDSVEEVVWSQSWQWGYYKHPPLPSLLMYVLNHLFDGPSRALTVFAAQGCNVIALFYVWLLAKRLLPHKLACVAVLITTLISYHNFKAVIYNHNTVSLPFTAAALYYFYCSIRQPEQLLFWLKLGIAGGLAMLTKYSAVLVFASFFVYLIRERLWANPLVIRGLLVSILVFMLIVLPHIIWLFDYDFLPFTYLDSYMDNQMTTFQSRLRTLINFSENQALRLSYLSVVVLLLIWFSPRKPIKVNTPEPSNIHDRRFLLIMLFTPMILALLPMLLKGGFLSSNWVSAFFLPVGILISSYFFCQHEEKQLLQNTQRLVWVIQFIVLLVYFIATTFYPAIFKQVIGSNFPSQLLANQVSTIWREHQKQVLTIVIADTWLGGNVLLHTRPEPILLIDNDTVISPWLTRDDVASCGALVLTTVVDKSTTVYDDLFKQANATGEFTLNVEHPPHGIIMNYAWAILSPEPNASPCRFNTNAD